MAIPFTPEQMAQDIRQCPRCGRRTAGLYAWWCEACMDIVHSGWTKPGTEGV